MGLVNSVVDARLEKLDYCAIWMTPAHQIHATRMPYVRLVQPMARSLARAHKVTKDRTALKTSMNAFKVIFEAHVKISIYN